MAKQELENPNYQNDNNEYLAQARLRNLERKAVRQRELDAQLAAELNLLLRGKAYSDKALRYASGTLAEFKDVLVDASPGRERFQAAMNWLDSAPDEALLAERWQVYELVMNARDEEREAMRLAQAAKRAKRSQQRAQDFFASTPGAPALSLAGEDSTPSSPSKKNALTFITTLSIRYDEDGQAQQWTHITDIAGKWRFDEKAYQKRVWRVLCKFTNYELIKREAHNFFVVERLAVEDWTNQRDKWKKRQQRGGEPVRWAKLPQESGAVVLIHDSASDAGANAQPLPTDEEELAELLHNYLRTPEDKRVAFSPGFGGNYEGMRGDGRRKKAKREGQKSKVLGQFITKGAGGIVGAACVLDIELSKRLSGGRELAHEDAMLALWDNGYTFTPRKVHQHKLAELFDAVTGIGSHQDEMSDISHIDKEPPLCDLDRTKEALPVVEDAPPEWAFSPPDATEVAKAVTR